MHALRGRAVELGALDPKLAGLLTSRMGAARNWDDRFAAMETLIAERVAQATAPNDLAWVWGKLEAADGRLALGPLASEIDCSHRTLIAQFRTCIGGTPKATGRLLRFSRAVRSLDALSRNRRGGPASKPYIEAGARRDLPALAVDWADLAADCGYFDQSHFIREFRRFAGATPTEFVRGMADIA
jgi:AraC-like DNA-binding protein